MKLNSNTIVIVILTIILLGGGYWFVTSSNSDNDKSLSAGADVNAKQLKFQTLARELEPIKFDTSIFKNPRFNSLVDISTSVVSEPVGRIDPFAPATGISN